MNEQERAARDLVRERALDIRHGKICLRYDSKKLGWRDYGGGLIKSHDDAVRRVKQIAKVFNI